MGNFFYTLVIYPLTLIIETAYQIVYELFGNVGFSIIGVSVAVSVLCLPLYIVAEKWQEVEREKQKQMEEPVLRIKESFRGDEQYMILSYFYRQNHYHPIMALRSSFGLLIQIPFFIAAYSFLSALPALEEKSFWFIRDLSKCDAIFSIGKFPVNILPIAMTIINIAGSAVYTRGFKLKEKLPIYAMALIFLGILYNSPSGLVLYWTMNNVFSLVKNIFYKLKRPLFVLYIIACVLAAFGICYVLFFHSGLFSKRLVMAFLFSVLFFIPLFVKGISFLLKGPVRPLVQERAFRHSLFLISSFSIALLAGAVIPSYAISSSVVEFMNIDNVESPLYYLANSFLQGAGIFVFWFSCVYFLFGKKVQAVLSLASSLFLLCGIVNSFLFGGSYGTLSSVLVFDRAVSDSALTIFLNVASLFVVAALLVVFVQKRKIFVPLFSIIMMSFLGISIFNTFKIQSEYKRASKEKISEEGQIEKFYQLSKTGRNVVVIMSDRAENAFVEPIFSAYPNIKEAFKDWTLYTHTLSYDPHTLMGAPGLYGGYEYTPLEMNKRAGVTLKEKNNEALLLMPRVFTEQAGFDAYVSDLSWANYSWVPDLSICEPYPKIKAKNIERKYTSKWMADHPECAHENAVSTSIKRNFLFFSMFKLSPAFMREALYDDGAWWSSDGRYSDMVGFLAYYSALDYLPELTGFDAGKNGSFILMENSVTHSSIDLQAPDFVPVKKVTDRGKFSDYESYDCISSNAALLLRLAEWMDYLKENGCYDNTRIILVADHGIGLGEMERTFFKKDFFQDLDFDHNRPLLMIKDFTDSNKEGKGFKTDSSFMTNADTPYLAFTGIVENPVNPFTGKPILPRMEKAAYGISTNGNYDPGQNGLYTFNLKGNRLFDVTDDMSDSANWKERK